MHQDFWWWDDSETLVAGFVPIGLAYHALLSVAAAVGWAMAARYCWPDDVDESEDSATVGGSAGAGDRAGAGGRA